MAGTINLLSPNKIRWILDEIEGIRATIDQTADPIGFSVPTDVIMIKEAVSYTHLTLPTILLV